MYNKGYLSEIADTDYLTGLYNRNFFDRWIPKLVSQAVRDKSTLSIAYLDINNLKTVNDTLGHSAGDKIIRTFARKLSKKLRLSDLAFRIGGDEFVAVLWSSNKENTEKVFKNLQESLQEVGIHFSFGVAEIESHLTVKESIERADKLMYEMKMMMKEKK